MVWYKNDFENFNQNTIRSIDFQQFDHMIVNQIFDEIVFSRIGRFDEKLTDYTRAFCKVWIYYIIHIIFLDLWFGELGCS